MYSVYVVGTSDTKDEDLHYVADRIRETGVPALVVDISTRPHDRLGDVSNQEVASWHPKSPEFISDNLDRGIAGVLMGEALSAFLLSKDDMGGVIGIGGSGNTAIITAAMRTLPIGVPKLMVSTMASSDVSGYVGPSDITMMYSVTDIAGLNPLSRKILGNAAHAIAGMVRYPVSTPSGHKPMLGMTMYGVTTPAVSEIQRMLCDTYDILIFHATGRGGQSLEKLIESQMITHIIDVTTTEIVDHLFGGIMSAGEDRLGAIIRTQIPYVGSVGAFDMITLGAKEHIPEDYQGRLSHMHNANITLVRTPAKECRVAGEWLADRLNAMDQEVRLLIPEGGLSQLDAPGQPFYDPEANQALFDTLRKLVKQTKQRKLIFLPYHINDPLFARELVQQFHLLQLR